MTTIIRDSIQIICLISVLIYHNWKLTLVTFIVAPLLAMVLKWVSKRIKRLTTETQKTYGNLIGTIAEAYRKLTLVTFIVAPLLAMVLKWVSKRIKRLTTETQKTYGNLIGTIAEAYNGQRVVKIYDGLPYERERFREVNQRLKNLVLKSQRVSAAGTPLTQLVAMSGVSIVVVVALSQAQMGSLTIGEFTTFLSAMLLLMPPIRHLSSLNGATAAMTAAAESLFKFIDEEPEKDPGTTELQRVKLLMPPIRHLSSLNGATAAMTAAAESLFKFIDEEPEKDPGTTELQRVKGAVRFEDVQFAYPNSEKLAVKSFNLDVKPGDLEK